MFQSALALDAVFESVLPVSPTTVRSNSQASYERNLHS